MKTNLKISLERLLSFGIVGILLALLYHGLFYPHTLPAFAQSSLIGFLLGTTTGVLEEYLLKDWFRQKSFTQALLLRTSLYAMIATVALMFVLTLVPFILGDCHYQACLMAYLNGQTFLQDLIFSVLIVFLITLIVQVTLLIGEQNMRRLLLGRFHQPRELKATFLFVDLHSSTSIAEQLGHRQFSAFLRDFFRDISPAIRTAKGEIYQYIGDEVIVVWSDDVFSDSASWLYCFSNMKTAIQKRTTDYKKTYGIVPTFKAGVHGGLVIASEIGSFQRALAYHGDILNTAARLQAKCNEVGFDLLATKSMVATLPLKQQADFERIGKLSLKGKQEEVVAYGFYRRKHLAKKSNPVGRNALLKVV